jgi:hypothetical protein
LEILSFSRAIWHGVYEMFVIWMLEIGEKRVDGFQLTGVNSFAPRR